MKRIQQAADEQNEIKWTDLKRCAGRRASHVKSVWSEPQDMATGYR